MSEEKIKRIERLDKSTPALLRRIAKDIENDKDTSFILCVVDSPTDLLTAQWFGKHGFTLMGLATSCIHRLNNLAEGVEHD